MKTAIKHENYEFLVLTLKHVSGLSSHANRPYTPKIAHKNGSKQQNDEFLVITLKHVSGLTSHANRPRNPKLWAIAHENSHRSGKLRVFKPYISIM